MPNADVAGRDASVSVNASEIGPVRSDSGVSGLGAQSGNPYLSVCVVCCSTASLPHDCIYALLKAFTPDAAVRAVVLSESGGKIEGSV